MLANKDFAHRATFIVLVSILVTICFSSPLEPRQLQGSSWSLYVYGEGINGLPICYADGLAKIGYASEAGAKVGRNVYFTCSTDSTSTWVAHVNETQPDLTTSTRSLVDSTLVNFGSSAADPTTMVLYLTDTGVSCSPIGFTKPIDTVGKNTDAFYQHDFDVLLKRRDASFYAKPDNNGSYTLMWSTRRDNGNIPVLLKTVGVWKQPVIMSLGDVGSSA